MRFRMVVLACGVVFIGGLACLIYERNRYNIVSHEELLSVREKLKVLSPQEKKDLAFFIDTALVFDHYSYTLVGYKPMSLSVVVVEDTEDLQEWVREAFKRPRYQTLRRGYLVLEKYQSLFPRKKLLVNYSFCGKGRKEVVLVCSNACMATIKDNLEDFREILGRQCVTEEVFWILTHPKHDDFYRMIDRTRLFGILLGYGKNNASLFEQYRGGISRSILGPQRSCQDSLQSFNDEWFWPTVTRLPDFACDPATEETKELKKHYENARKTIRWTYFFRNNLEVTLALLMQN